jgi:Uma2 family endonuclease
MGERGILGPEDRVELLDGFLVNKPMQNSPHGSTVVRLTHKLIVATMGGGWQTRIHVPITLAGSEPEPDAALARGDLRTYDSRHPDGSEVGLVIEIAESSLTTDRIYNEPICARAGIPVYWIINIPEAQIEVYTQPSGPSASPAYSLRTGYTALQAVPLVLDGQTVASIPVTELLP